MCSRGFPGTRLRRINRAKKAELCVCESVVFCCVERWVRQLLMSKYNIPYNKKLVNY